MDEDPSGNIKQLERERLKRMSLSELITARDMWYGRYMFEEAAERGWDGKASNHAFKEYYKYVKELKKRGVKET